MRTMPTPVPLTCQAEHQCSQGKQQAEHPWHEQSLGKKAKPSTALGVLLRGLLLRNKHPELGKSRRKH